MLSSVSLQKQRSDLQLCSTHPIKLMSYLQPSSLPKELIPKGHRDRQRVPSS